MRVRYANRYDKADVYQWRNDETSRLMSINTDFVEHKENYEWWNSALSDPHKFILIGEDSMGKIGVVQLNYNKDKTEIRISINLNPLRRGQRLSSDLLNAAIDFAEITKGVKLIAKIKHLNVISLKCFTKCGFVYNSEDADFVGLVRSID